MHTHTHMTLFGNEIFVDVSKSNEVILMKCESISHSIECKSLGPHEL